MPTNAPAVKLDTTPTDQLFASREEAKAAVAAAESLGATGRVAARRAAFRLDEITNAIVTANYGLVRNYVNRFVRTERSRTHAEDYEQAAVLGLLAAIDTYNPNKGTFAQWAWKRIQREVLSIVANTEFSTVTSNDFEQRPKVLVAQKALIESGIEHPTITQIAAEAGTTVPMTKRIIEAPRLESVDAPIAGGDEGSQTLADTLIDPNTNIDDQVVGPMVIGSLEANGLNLLSARELFVIVRRFGLDGEPPAKLVRIGKLLGVSREAARQVESKAISKLNHPALLGDIIENVK